MVIFFCYVLNVGISVLEENWYSGVDKIIMLTCLPGVLSV